MKEREIRERQDYEQNLLKRMRDKEEMERAKQKELKDKIMH